MKAFNRPNRMAQRWARVAFLLIAFALMGGIRAGALEAAYTSKAQTRVKKKEPASRNSAALKIAAADTGKTGRDGKKTSKSVSARPVSKAADPAPPASGEGDVKKDDQPAESRSVPTEPSAEKKAEKPVEAATPGEAEKSAEEPAATQVPGGIPSDFNNWMTVSGTGLFVDGDKQNAMQRLGTSKNFSGGLEDFHMEGEIEKDVNFEIDGRALIDNHDYHLQLQVTRADVGYIKTGYREFRTWYDGSGGYFPQNGLWFPIVDGDVYSIDRGEVWFESGLTMPDVPEIVFRYSHEFRNGRKDSTSWGNTTLTGGFGTRSIVPSFWQIDETSDNFGLDVKDSVDETSFGGGLRYELSNQDNTLNIRRSPYQTTDRAVTQHEILSSDLFNVRGFTETDLDENTKLTTACSYTNMSTEMGGSRIYGSSYDSPYIPRFGPRQANDEGFLGLAGGSKLDQYVAAVNFMMLPLEDCKFVLGVRAEDERIDSLSTYMETNVGAAPALTPSITRQMGKSDNENLNVNESMEFQYSGFNDWLLYVKADWEQTQGDIYWEEQQVDTQAIDILWTAGVQRFSQKYAFGSNWYPLKEVNVALEYYHKISDTSYDEQIDLTPPAGGNRYPGFIVEQDFTTDDVNFRVKWRPASNVTSVSRYDFQLATIDSQMGALNSVESAEITTHMFSENVTWNPCNRLYLQGLLNWVISLTDTPANTMLGAAQNQVWDSMNSYWTGSFVAGYALTDHADLQAIYTYYRAYDYRDNSRTGLPYGAGNEEQSVTLGVIWRVADNVQWSARYGFFRNLDQTSGGFNNYDAHLAYTSVQVGF